MKVVVWTESRTPGRFGPVSLFTRLVFPESVPVQVNGRGLVPPAEIRPGDYVLGYDPAGDHWARVVSVSDELADSVLES